jgi:hypothetical protein
MPSQHTSYQLRPFPTKKFTGQNVPNVLQKFLNAIIPKQTSNKMTHANLLKNTDSTILRFPYFSLFKSAV